MGGLPVGYMEEGFTVWLEGFGILCLGKYFGGCFLFFFDLLDGGGVLVGFVLK